MTRTENQADDARAVRPGFVLAGFVLLVFCTASAEYLVAGVLPQLASDVSVTIATAGQTVTAYALGVAIGGPLVTVLTAAALRTTPRATATSIEATTKEQHA